MMRSDWLFSGWILLVCALALLAPWLAPYDPLTQNLPRQLEAPSAEHWLGTDFFGRDLLSRLLYGGRATLLMGLAASLLSAGLGVGLGALASLEIPLLTFWIERLLESLLALPSLLIALVAITLLGSSQSSVILALGLSGVGVYGSTARDHLRHILAQPYIEGAVSLGASRPYILWAYVWPNARPQLVTFWGVMFTWALLNGSALTFLGFVPNPDDPNWGVMLAAGRQTFLHAPYEALSAGVALTLTIGALNRLTG
jgi:ABC-type dipeptide/oligopeptide/nickel transport system permease subunit